jgi:hypothetical protein
MVTKHEYYYYEYGWRLADGTEEWASSFGTDGVWTSYDSAHGIEAIDMYDGQEVEAIYKELDRAGVEGVALRRLVRMTTIGSEVVDRPSIQ